jgi:hypothetical protein
MHHHGGISAVDGLGDYQLYQEKVIIQGGN